MGKGAMLETMLIMLVPLWVVEVGDSSEAGYSSPLVTDRRIYITGNVDETHVIFCFDTDGKPVWTYRGGKAWTDMFPGTRGTPVLENGKIYDESPHGELVCLHADTGKPIWRRNLLNDYETPNILYGRSASLLIEGQKLYTQLGGDKASMLCLDKRSGETIWKGRSTGYMAGYGTPVIFEFEKMPIIAAMDAKGVFAVNRETGKLLFHVRHPARLDENISTPIYHDGKLFITNGAGSDSKCLRLTRNGDEVEATELWSNHFMANSHGGVVLLDGKLYGATNKRGGGFACIDFETGNDGFLDRRITRGSFDVQDGMFAILTEFAEVVVAVPKEKNFEVLARLQLPGGEGGQAYSHPVVHGNRLYVRIGEKLHCVEIRKVQP